MEAIIDVQITTWNMLNPQFENEKWYSSTAVKYLHWDSSTNPRKPVLLDFLKPLKSQIYSLQETNSNIVMEILQSLNKKNPIYDVIYHPRNKHDGCAIFYDKVKLELDINNIKLLNYPGGHLVQACCFQLQNNPNKKFWVINTHVKWATRDTDLIYLKSIIDNFFEGKIILMGDFNATMNEQWYSHYINGGYLNMYEVCQKKIPGATLYPKATYNCGKKDSKTIDYMISKNIKAEDHIKSFLGNNPESPISPDFVHEYLPNSEIPSDHIPVSCIICL